MSNRSTQAALPLVLQLEEELQISPCRSNRARVLELLAPDFTEVGASGRAWDRSSTLELLASRTEGGAEIEVPGWSVECLPAG